CWQDNPSGRPEMQQVFSELKLVNLNTSELIEKCIKEKDVEYYGYNEFNKIEEIASGLVSKVYKAHWERNGKCVALKLFNLKDDAIAKEAVHEIKLHREVDLSNVMIKLFGITKTDLGEYLLITEYAEGDTLRNYLKENFPSLNWLDKYRLALQLSNAIRYLHEREMTDDSENYYDFGINEPSKQAVLVESGELNMSLYEGHPLVYTFINDRSSNTNLLSFNSDEDCVEFNESLQPSDICEDNPNAHIKDKGKKRSKDDDDQASEHLPRFKLRIDEPPMDLDFSNTYQQQTISSPLPSYSTYSNFSTISTHSTYSNPVFDNNQKLFPQETSLNSNYIPSQEDNELNRFKMMSIDNIVDLTRKNTSDTTANLDLVSNLMFKEVCSITQNIEEFTPLIKSFLALRKEIVSLYEKAEHHKELCSFLLQRCNCAMVTVEDLYIRKTENEKFFYKQGNLNLFKDFIKCIKRIKNFIEEISQLGKYRKFLLTNNIEETFSELTTEFDGYMNSLNFPFTIQAIDEFKVIKNETREIKKLLVNVYGVSDDKQSQQKFLKDMDSLAERNKEFQKQSKQNKVLDSSDFKLLEVNEPLLDGNDYQRTKICPSRRIEKRTLSSDDNIIQEFYLLWTFVVILHHDIQSANILVNINEKIKITNFGSSKKFYDLTRNISPNIENVRYMAPEKLLTDNNTKKEKVPYDLKCEIY
ncbi:7880_t:CDS:2, partial [Rhizophagus irregularis]